MVFPLSMVMFAACWTLVAAAVGPRKLHRELRTEAIMSMPVDMIIDFDSSNNLVSKKISRRNLCHSLNSYSQNFYFPRLCRTTKPLPIYCRFAVHQRERSVHHGTRCDAPSLDTFWECDTGRKDRAELCPSRGELYDR